MRLRVSHGLFVFLISVLCGIPALAQQYRATITGRVIDAQQAAVPSVKVTCTSADTGAVFDTVSGSDGAFTVPFLPPGLYNVSAEASGFKSFLRKGIQLTTNQRLQLDISLEIGGVNETVTVSSETPILETATASTGQVINSQQMQDMPVNGRTPLILAQLASGIIPSSSPRFVRPFDNSGASTFSMGGAPATSNELLIDGAPDIGTGGQVAYNPPMDAVTEVKVESFQADAAYGHTGGGTVNVLIKSGTNNFHGTLYEFNQTSALDATSWFLNSSRQKKVVTRYNQYGGSAGGPVFIPKVMDGRNKLFFFFAYEGIKTSSPQPTAYTVPTTAERGGDFSALLSLGSQYGIYDPVSGVRQGARIQRALFPNNVIPSNRLSPIAKNLEQFYSLPNFNGGADGENNFISSEVPTDQYSNELTRIDLNASSTQKVSFSIRHNQRANHSGNPFDNIANLSITQRVNWGGGIDHVATLTPTLILNTRVSYIRYYRPNVPASVGYDITQAGFPASLAAAATSPRLPSLSFSKYSSLAPDNETYDANDTYQIFSALTKIVGNHSLKMGTDLRLYRNSSSSPGKSTGVYTFGTQWTNGPLDSAAASPIGQDFAAFLLGFPTSGSFDVNASSIYQAGFYSLFVQDDFRVRQNLTLNLGIRYERDMPTTERFNRSVNGFDFGATNPINAAAAAAYAQNPIAEIPASQFRANGGLLFAGPNDRHLYNTEANNFSPRFGFAWTPPHLGGKTVIRGGFGMYYFPLGVVGLNQAGFSQSTSLVATNDNYLTPYAVLSNPFPNGISQPAGSTAGLSTFLGKSVTFFNPNPVNPYSLRWTFNVQRELPSRISIEIGYQGNHAVHLTDSANLDYVPAQYLSTKPVRDQATIDHLSASVPNPFAGLLPGTALNGSTIALSSLLAPYPQFTGVSETGLGEGSSVFHQGTLRAEKRFSKGFSLMVNYQYSKMLTRISRLNDADAQLAKRVAAEDRPQRLTVSASYELPFGKGKALLSSAPGVVNGIIGGWNVNGIYVRQSGPVLQWGNVIYYGGNLNPTPRNVASAFDVTQFDRKSADQLASNLRTFPLAFGNVRADGVNNFDFSVLKQFKLREGLKLQYRCELFNAFNHPVFSAANTTPTSSAFGTISSVDNLARVIQMGLRLAW